MPIGQSQIEPYNLNYVTANRFYIDIGGVIHACFTDCSGLGMTIDTEIIHEGGVNNQKRGLLKQAKFDNITLKRGVTDDMFFWQWGSQVLRGSTSQRLNISILLFNQAGETMQTYFVVGAVPVSWKAPSFSAKSSEVAIEELSLAYEGLQIYSTTAIGASSAGAAKAAIAGAGMSRQSLGYFFGSN